MSGYVVVYNPASFDFMTPDGARCTSPHDLITFLSGAEAFALAPENYARYLQFDLGKCRGGMVETFGIENGAAIYIGNQIASLWKNVRVLHADDHRVALPDILARETGPPAAVFITCISANFPAAVAAALVLNHARIPVVIGGIHVSAAPQDVDVYVRNACLHPELVAHVVGPGDSQVFREILQDLDRNTLQREYFGHVTIEDGVWRTPPNVTPLPPLHAQTRGKTPFLGRLLNNRVRIVPAAPMLGCPYSCSFCSVSTLPLAQRTLAMRTPDDFLDELASRQEERKRSELLFFLFCTDNLLLGGASLDAILNGIVKRNLKTPFVAQISIDVASDEALLERLRLAGALLFEIGFESLDMRNLQHINKHVRHDIRAEGLSVPEYYARQIAKIHQYGIAIQGSFIFGLPFDRFNSLEDNTGTEVAQFCIDNNISLMAGCLNASPGAKDFDRAVEAGCLLYGAPGSMDYLRALCLTDHGEMNTRPGEALRHSPLLPSVMALEALRRVGGRWTLLRSALRIGGKAYACPTARGRASLFERIEGALLTAGAELITGSLYRDVGERLAASCGGKTGGLERQYAAETDNDVKRMCEAYVSAYNSAR